MASQIFQIVPFTAVAAAGSATLAHNINDEGTAYIPDEARLDNGDFEVTACTSTSITVQNNGAAPADCNVLLMLWPSPTRAFGDGVCEGFVVGLTPRPFVAAG